MLVAFRAIVMGDPNFCPESPKWEEAMDNLLAGNMLIREDFTQAPDSFRLSTASWCSNYMAWNSSKSSSRLSVMEASITRRS